jgi:hypothetical protein
LNEVEQFPVVAVNFGHFKILKINALIFILAGNKGVCNAKTVNFPALRF